MTQAPPQAFFLPATAPSTGERFCVFHAAQGDQLRGRVVYVHPFAEEMNKSRRMAALQSRALAAAGFSVLQIDLHGCGDSSGDFGDASWDDWVNDVLQAVAWLSERDARHAAAPLWLWGLRCGCLIAAQAAAKLTEAVNFCFWQPTTSGKPVLQQFLRIKLAADMLSGNAKGLMEAMRQALAAGQPVEVAGYAVSPALANGLEKASLAAPEPIARQHGPVRLEWLELSRRTDIDVTPVTQQCLTKWQLAAYSSRHQFVEGPNFWQTQEIEDAPALLEATCAAFLTHSSTALANRAVSP
ncbi:hydrolase 2, exosortase A system-associated [Roseateles sp.]|uniref:hydrolase 2, exosortase A system-associated n=1 Tax=Roseateles sp. TaxID=1971397 RepID=UPI00286CD32C|nr:hydrolase 2, exosortase A system-associated [Roseateles sp.]